MDLKQLAYTGTAIWQTLVPDVDDRSYLHAHLTGQAKIQVSRTTAATFPWSLVYDIARDPDQDATLCPLVQDWDTNRALLAGYPATCPFSDQGAHRLNVICPYGFWGFRHLIEQPLPVRTGLLRQKIRVEQPAQAAASGCRTLADPELTRRHFTDLNDCLAKRFTMVRCDTREMLQQAFADPRLPLAYFYCHGKSEPKAGIPTPYLEIGDGVKISPGAFAAWHEDGNWGPTHWQDTAPLIFLNGCETANLLPGDMLTFVDAFAGLHAAGVVGTEISVSQAVAAEVALSFYRRFAGSDNASVGEALRRTRIDLLRKGNISGLVYTPFCSMDLVLATDEGGEPS